MTGRTARTHSRYGGTSSIAADSGPAIAMFFGTISPSSTCNTTTIVIATTNDTVCSTAPGTPNRSNGFSNTFATAGSPMRPNRIEHTVIPSCAPASITERFCPARITVTALRLPCSASASSRSRRAEISANSAPTKKAFASNSRRVSTTPSTSAIGDHRAPVASWKLDEIQLIDAATVHLRDGRAPSDPVLQGRIGLERLEFHRLTRLGDGAELGHDQPADRLVFAFMTAESGGTGHFVDAQQARHPPPTAGAHDIRCRLVVFVTDVADDLLDQVLDGHPSRDAAAPAGHQRGLKTDRADLRHQRGAVEGGRTPRPA